MHAFDRQTDGRTNRILIARQRLHSMRRGKNYSRSKRNYGVISTWRIDGIVQFAHRTLVITCATQAEFLFFRNKILVRILYCDKH